MTANKELFKRVRAARERLKDVARRTTERAAAGFQGAQDQLGDRDRALAELAAAVPERLARASSIDALVQVESERSWAQQARAEAVTVLAGAQKGLDQARRQLEGRARDLEVVERALERLEASMAERERRREQLVLDDLSAQRFGRLRR